MFGWLLEESVWARLSAVLSTELSLSDEQIKAITPLARAEGMDPYILTRAADKGEINVEGILSETFDIEAFLVGGGNTTYQDIRQSLAVMDNDPEIKKAVMRINSPGGGFVGLLETLDAMRAFTKPLDVVVSGQAASAAYALATAGDSITAVNESALFGSIGIVVEMETKENGVKISSTKAPKKAPDVKTEEGRAIVREELDSAHELFVKWIAEGRGVSVDTVNGDFGKGATVLAAKALSVGMIDKIQTKVVKPKETKTTTRAQSGRKEVKAMDLAKLRAEHPALYDQVFALGAAQGETQERDRVSAHLIMGEATGAMKTAIEAVKNGDAMTEALRATYQTAGFNKNSIDARAQDDVPAGDAANGAGDDLTDEEKDKQLGVSIMQKAAANCGVNFEAK